MGLDCYVRIAVNTDDPDAPDSKELWYGRKENEIHGWMQSKSDLTPEEFNCERLYLSEELLTELEEDFKAKLLTPVDGFFFGPPNDMGGLTLAVQDLIAVSRQALAAGKKPYYFSWW